MSPIREASSSSRWQLNIDPQFVNVLIIKDGEVLSLNEEHITPYPLRCKDLHEEEGRPRGGR